MSLRLSILLLLLPINSLAESVAFTVKWQRPTKWDDGSPLLESDISHHVVKITFPNGFEKEYKVDHPGLSRRFRLVRMPGEYTATVACCPKDTTKSCSDESDAATYTPAAINLTPPTNVRVKNGKDSK
jgi:hypothetical protein